MQLYLMRHGDATYGVPDASRELSILGQKQLSLTANKHCAELADVQIVLTSNLTRAIQSADILMAEAALTCPSQIVDFLLPQAQVTSVEIYLQSTAYQSIIMVGHLPLLGMLIDYFTGSTGASLGTASLASLSLEYPAQGLATLNWIYYAP